MTPSTHKVRREIERAVQRARSSMDRVLGRPRKTHVVICGYPRSGTSLLYNMLAVALSGYRHDDFEHSCLAYVREWRDTLSKRPLDVFKIEEFVRKNRLAKRLVVIVVIRDPRDILTSRHPRVPDDYFIGWDACYRVDGSNGPERLHPGIGAIARSIEGLDGVVGIEAVRVRYEDLVAHPDSEQERLTTSTHLPLEGRFADFHVSGQLAYRYEGERAALDPGLVREDRPLDPTRAGKWRSPEHSARITAQFTDHPELFELVRRYGYETDDAWFEPYRARD